MTMTAEERRIAKNEASRRWYAKHKAALEKPEAQDESPEQPQDPEPEAVPDDVECDDIADDMQLDSDGGIDDDNDDIDEDDIDEDDIDDEVDEWAAGREDMFREFGAQGYMEED